MKIRPSAFLLPNAGATPIAELLKSNELLVQNVLPRLGIKPTRKQPHLRAEYKGAGWREQSEVGHGRS